MVAIKARIINNALDIQLSACPSGAVMTIWYGEKMLRRLQPSTTHITIPAKGLVPIPPLPLPPILPRRALAVCLWAPGYRYNEARVPV